MQQFVVDGESMLGTLHSGDRVLVNKLSYHLHDRTVATSWRYALTCRSGCQASTSRLMIRGAWHPDPGRGEAADDLGATRPRRA